VLAARTARSPSTSVHTSNSFLFILHLHPSQICGR
jgi:hypothetical protein